jgi:hypothetical protein
MQKGAATGGSATGGAAGCTGGVRRGRVVQHHGPVLYAARKKIFKEIRHLRGKPQVRLAGCAASSQRSPAGEQASMVT